MGEKSLEENEGCIIVLEFLLRCLGKGIVWGYKGGKHTTKFLYDHRGEIAQGTGAVISAGAGAVKGTAEFAYNTGSLFLYTKKEVSELEEKIKEQSKRYKIVLEDSTTLDMGIIAGVVLTDKVLESGSIPESVENAYVAAYPNLAAEKSFTEAVESYDSAELNGFLAGIKGKLFEIQYVDHLNNGNLPDGYEAILAAKANQPGWDVAVVGPDDSVVEVLQCKATDSISHITSAAEKYPDIDIVTFDDTYSKLAMHSSLEGIDLSGSGIDSTEVLSPISEAIDSGESITNLVDINIPFATLALTAFTAYTEEDKSIYQKSFTFGDRGTKSMIALTAGGILAGITGTWWMLALGSIGTRYVASKGKQMREKCNYLYDIISRNEKVISRMEVI